MEIYQSIILGIVQGLTEFLPISSSAHLKVFPWIFNWPTLSDGMDVALHIGTLLALVIFFFKDWVNLVKAGYKKAVKKEDSTEGKMFWYLVVATIPAALVGLLLDDIIENVIRNKIWLIALSLAVMGVLIYVGDKWASKHYKKETKFENITLKQAIIIVRYVNPDRQINVA